MQNWLVPTNPDIYDVAASFDENGFIDWRQNKNKYAVGDIVYLYCSQNIRKIMFKTIVEKINIPPSEVTKDKKFWKVEEEYIRSPNTNYFRIRLLEQIDREELSFENLKKQGLKGNIQGPRKLDNNLVKYIEQYFESETTTDTIEWTDFYMEFADRLLDFKDNRQELIKKIQKIYTDLNMNLPSLEADSNRNIIIPYDIDPFTVFALFNKQISEDTRIMIVNQIKSEFSISAEPPNTFHGIAVVNNMSATFYYFDKKRGENDINNLWSLFETALNYSENKDDKTRENFITIYNKVLSQKGIKWNITMALNWIRPYTFINLDSNNRTLLSNESIFSEELRNEIKSLKNSPNGEKYLQICDTVQSNLNKTNKYADFPSLSHSAYLSKLNDDDNNIESDDGIGDSDIETVHYWLYSSGHGDGFWDEFYEKGIMAIGWNELGNFKEYNNKTEIQSKLQEINNDNSSYRNNVHAVWQFANEVKEGDIVFVKKGWDKIIGRGIVESEYQYDENMKPYHNLRKVNWTHKGTWHSEDKLPTKTLTDITNYQEFLNNIKNLFLDEDENIIEEGIEYPKYSIEDFLKEVYINPEDYDTLKNLLKNKKNLIIQGAPGVGKTFMAKRLAYSMMGVKDIERVLMVQFHQSYAYEDFVMGYKPSKEGFEIKNGSFYKFCKKAEEDSENDYFFIIDEINRGNLSKIFGELFMLIENDKRGEKNKIQLLYSDEYFFIPKNLYIVGLMNTADRSLAMIDYALRRRFAFFDLKPGFKSKGFKEYQEEIEDTNFDNLIEIMNDLNNEIENDESLGEGFRIGHSYLCNIKSDKVEEKLDYIIKYELIPLLKEYWFDEPDKIEYWSDRLRSVIN